MDWNKFAIEWAGYFRPFQQRDTALMKSLQVLVDSSPEQAVRDAMMELAERYNATREAGITPPLPTKWQLEQAIRRHTPNEVTGCSFCIGTGYVRCAHDRRMQPIQPGQADRNTYVYASDFPCPFCRGKEYADYYMKEAVKRCCTSSSHTTTDVIRAAYFGVGK